MQKYNIDYSSFHFYLIAARKHNFYSNDDINDIINYFESINFIENNSNKIIKKVKKDIKFIEKQYIQFENEFYNENKNYIKNKKIIIDFNKDNIEIKQQILKEFFCKIDEDLLNNFVTVLYSKNIYSKKNLCLTVGLNRAYRIDIDLYIFMILGSKNCWEINTLDDRNYKIKHNYDNYKMEIYYNISEENLDFTEISLAIKNNAIFWNPSINQLNLYKSILYGV